MRPAQRARTAADHANENRKFARRIAESSPLAQEARKGAPRDASGPRGRGRGPARAAEKVGLADPHHRKARATHARAEHHARLAEAAEARGDLAAAEHHADQAEIAAYGEGE